VSPLADNVAICLICVSSDTGTDISFNSATTAFTAASIPFLTCVAFVDAYEVASNACVAIECANTVDVVVPSPAASTVFSAACFITVAPMFSIGSSNTTVLATLTPSLVDATCPCSFSINTLRPNGPIVTDTALLTLSIPAFNFSFASLLKLIILLIFYFFLFFQLNHLINHLAC